MLQIENTDVHWWYFTLHHLRACQDVTHFEITYVRITQHVSVAIQVITSGRFHELVIISLAN